MREIRFLEIDSCNKCPYLDDLSGFCSKLKRDIETTKTPSYGIRKLTPIPKECPLTVLSKDMDKPHNLENVFYYIRKILFDSIIPRLSFYKLNELEHIGISAGSVHRIKNRVEGIKTKSLMKVLRKLENEEILRHQNLDGK